jgi:hypothetical protein
MKRYLRALLVAGLLAGGLTLWPTSAEAQPWRRGWGPYGGFGRVRVYRPYAGYGFYRPYGYVLRGYGWGYPGYGYAFGYPGYPVIGAPVSGYGITSYPGAIGWGYPGYYGTSVSIGGGPFGGVMVSSYPW